MRSLSRRVRTLLVAGVLFLVLFVLALTLPVPYVLLSPGPTLNTLGDDGSGAQIITIDGTKLDTTSGHLNLTTVSENSQQVTVFQALVGWLQGDVSVVPRSAIFPPGQTQQQVDTQNTQDFTDSQDSAAAAAICELGYPHGFGVIDATGAAKGRLEPGDVIATLDGAPANSPTLLTALLSKTPAGTTVQVGVVRAGKKITVPVTLGPPPSGATGGRLGISVTTPDSKGVYGCLAPFTVTIGLNNEIGGPSAGLMFALGIMDKIGTVDLTKGRFIAGTGTIDPDGTVGPIGGIQLKMIAARRAGATLFLAPAGNCADVRGATPKGLTIVKVTSLHDAVQSLEATENGSTAPTC